MPLATRTTCFRPCCKTISRAASHAIWPSLRTNQRDAQRWRPISTIFCATRAKIAAPPGCLIVNTAAEQGTGNEPIRSIVEKGIERTERHLARTIALGVEDGSIRADVDPDTAALCISATLLGIRVLARAGASTDKIAKLIRSNLECHAPKP